MFIQFIMFLILCGILGYVLIIHIKINKTEDIVSSIANTDNKLSSNADCVVNTNDMILTNLESNVKEENNDDDNAEEKSISVDEIESTSKVELTIDEVITSDKTVSDNVLFNLTQERLNSIDRTFEEQQEILQEINLEEQCTSEILNEEPVKVDVDYSSILSQERKKEVMQSIAKSTPNKWYEQIGNGVSIEKITPPEDFTIEEYKY